MSETKLPEQATREELMRANGWLAFAWAQAQEELMQLRAAHQWRRVKDEMPKSGVPVFAYFVNSYGHGRRIRAEYAAPNTLPVSDDAEDGEGTYDEKTDTYYCSEGWYESNEYEETHWKVTDKVTHWQPLPDPPADEVSA